MSMYRANALAHRGRPESFDEPVRVNAPHEPLLIMLALGVLAAAALWIALGRFERSVQAVCTLEVSGRDGTIAVSLWVPEPAIDQIARGQAVRIVVTANGSGADSTGPGVERSVFAGTIADRDGPLQSPPDWVRAASISNMQDVAAERGRVIRARIAADDEPLRSDSLASGRERICLASVVVGTRPLADLWRFSARKSTPTAAG